MQYLIYRANKQEGPFNADIVRERLARGELSSADLCFTDGMTAWKPIAQVAELSSPAPLNVPPPSPGIAPVAQTPVSAPVGPSKPSFWQTVLEKLSITAQLTQKQAMRKKLELSDLRNADYRTGKKAYEGGLTPPECAGVVAQINHVRQQLAALNAEQVGPTNTISEKAKEVAAAAARTAKIQTLHAREGLLLTQLGEKIRALPPHPALETELGAARHVTGLLAGLDAEIASLSTKTYSWARQPLWAAIAILVIGGIALGVHLMHGGSGTAVAIYNPSLPAVATYEQPAPAAPHFVYPAGHVWVVDEATDRAVEHGEPGPPTPEQVKAYGDAQSRLAAEQQANDLQKIKDKGTADAKTQADAQAAQQADQGKEMAQNKWQAEHPYDRNTDTQKKTLADEMAQLPAWISSQSKTNPTAVDAGSFPAAVDINATPLGPATKDANEDNFLLRSADLQHTFVLGHQGTNMVAYIDGKMGKAYPRILWGSEIDGSSINSPTFSPDGQSVAYLAVTPDNRQVAVVDGIESEPFDKFETITYGAQGHTLFYVGDTGDKRRIFQGGKEIDTEPPRIGLTKLLISPDGQHIAFYRYTNIKVGYATHQQITVMRDGQPQSAFDGNRGMVFSGDSQHLAYVAVRSDPKNPNGGQAVAVIDDKQFPDKGDIQSLVLSRNGGHYAYVSLSSLNSNPLPFNPTWHQYGEVVSVIWDGHEFGHYSHVNIGELTLSPNGDRVAYILPVNINRATNISSKAVVDNGHQGKAYDECRDLVFSPDGTKLMYTAIANHQIYRVVNGKEFGPYTGPEYLKGSFSPDSTHFAYFDVEPGEDTNNPRLFIDGQPFDGPTPDWALSHEQLGAKKESVTYTPSDRLKLEELPDNKGPRVALDGHFGPPFRVISEMLLSPDGKHVAYLATANPSQGGDQRQQVVIDGSSTPKFDEFFKVGPPSSTCSTHLAFQPDGSLQFLATQNNTIYRCTISGADIAALPTIPQLDATSEGWRPLDFSVHAAVTEWHGFNLGADGRFYSFAKSKDASRFDLLLRTEGDGSNTTILHTFGQTNADLAGPEGVIVRPNGDVFGYCSNAGPYQKGGVFRIDGATGAYSMIYPFQPPTGQGNDGFRIAGFGFEGASDPSLVVAKMNYNDNSIEIIHMKPDGSGVTTMSEDQRNYYGGINGECGAFYSVQHLLRGQPGVPDSIQADVPAAIVRSSTLQSGSMPIYNFAGAPDDIAEPLSILAAPDGKLYGSGDANGPDYIFRINRDGSDYKILCKSLTGMRNSPLVWLDGMLYTACDKGIVQISPSDGNITILAPALNRHIIGAHDGVLYCEDSSSRFRYILSHGTITPPALNFKVVTSSP